MTKLVAAYVVWCKIEKEEGIFQQQEPSAHTRETTRSLRHSLTMMFRPVLAPGPHPIENILHTSRPSVLTEMWAHSPAWLTTLCHHIQHCDILYPFSSPIKNTSFLEYFCRPISSNNGPTFLPYRCVTFCNQSENSRKYIPTY